MKNINIQRIRTMKYFVDAADEIMKEEGIDKVTIRKVAQKAGYNSATLYNYFENLDHLIFFAAMRYIKPYALALPEYIKDASNSLDKFVLIWECFSLYSFKKPKTYKAIFFADLSKNIYNYITNYYKLFPEDLGDPSGKITTMLLKNDIYDRGLTSLEDAIIDGYISRENANDLNYIITTLYKGMLLDFINQDLDYDKTVKDFNRHLKILVEAYSNL